MHGSEGDIADRRVSAVLRRDHEGIQKLAIAFIARSTAVPTPAVSALASKCSHRADIASQHMPAS